MKVKRKHCIFCENGKSFKKKEHVFPDWLLEELNYKTKTQPFFETQFNKITDFEVDSVSKLRANFNFDNFRSPYVCDDCNGGWMCNLEGKIKPILVPPIHEHRGLETLTKSEKLLIARWAVKTTCVIKSVNFFKLSNFSFDPKVIRNRQTLPPGWAVFAFTHKPTSTISWYSNNVCCIEGILTDELQAKVEESRKTIFQLKNLVIATIFIGSENLKLKAVNSIHFPIDINLNYEWVSEPASPSFTSFKNVVKNSSDDVMFKSLGALSLRVI